MGVKPIPRSLLIHEVEYEEYAGSDGWDGGYNPSLTIKNVRVEPVSRLNRSSNSEGVSVSHVVVVDKQHSSIYPPFKVQSRITFEGRSYEIIDAKPFYAFGDVPHHYELELA
ncbi:Minor capsid protein [Virgibacillus subterraneus]|uniref:Minor capsid protein n=1 Tax=Virgibacillus subterraneus TaxID=621109 RepID=A0A1H8YXH9_9BACI|nr:putative minor capsid protein [Virgibacillus subterraneus]SEP56899.1 Minor capsid protein [Virgibacillus subterraneus]